MSEQKIIGIFGCEQTDLCIYLASILENMRNRVLVIDNSFDHKKSFRDAKLTFTEEQVKAETARCLGCGASVVDPNKCIGCG